MSQSAHPHFRLSGEFNPDDVTRVLEIEPSWIARIGDQGPSDANGPRKGATWIWEPSNDDSNDLGDQLAYMAGALTLKREEIASLVKKFDGTIHVFDSAQTKRNWFLSADTLQKIADLKVNIECESISFKERVVEEDAD